ncbi:MAG: RNase adapter RapZ [Synechococcaceae cyanobacterium SM2_3_2]|nr:RNase adapter RapZ [Synechococcaceae cyanobacterium SM2_3_2]
MATMQNSVSTVVIAGSTGVGKSLALQQLEVLGFVGVDSLAPSMVASVHGSMRHHHPRLAYVLDLRGERLIREAETLVPWCAQLGIPLVFLTASPEMLARRQTTSRRRHPFGSTGGAQEAIEVEDQYLQSLQEQSSHRLDTTALNPMQIRSWFETLVQGGSVPLTVTVVSFGYKFGLPTDANLVFDIRFLPNPYFVAELRPLSGLDPVLREYIFQHELTQRTYRHIETLMKDWIPAYQAEQRAHLTVAIGCTGGQHRSVAVVEQLAEALTPNPGDPDGIPTQPQPYKLQVVHRHLQQSRRDVSHTPVLWESAQIHSDPR